MSINIGVIGAGRIGKLHAEVLALRTPEANVSAIADINVAAARETAAKLGIPKAT
ncbi:MAG: Gfo/Idh/MocA family oxidoreductase, partial [Burkholderiales bacterium]|nr:Gfo/Idh/MocA family oxidoreductase [Anaerolineae bacterium]